MQNFDNLLIPVQKNIILPAFMTFQPIPGTNISFYLSITGSKTYIIGYDSVVYKYRLCELKNLIPSIKIENAKDFNGTYNIAKGTVENNNYWLGGTTANPKYITYLDLGRFYWTVSILPPTLIPWYGKAPIDWEDYDKRTIKYEEIGNYYYVLDRTQFNRFNLYNGNPVIDLIYNGNEEDLPNGKATILGLENYYWNNNLYGIYENSEGDKIKFGVEEYKDSSTPNAFWSPICKWGETNLAHYICKQNGLTNSRLNITQKNNPTKYIIGTENDEDGWWESIELPTSEHPVTFSFKKPKDSESKTQSDKILTFKQYIQGYSEIDNTATKKFYKGEVATWH